MIQSFFDDCINAFRIFIDLVGGILCSMAGGVGTKCAVWRSGGGQNAQYGGGRGHLQQTMACHGFQVVRNGICNHPRYARDSLATPRSWDL